ncbi:MAG: M28 family peptidase [Gemmatimonadetes bacterium]|nr:M28 family peptidase [Gemmatimonadota bacterium]MBT8403955.1 M28 family peptidase [Gemmatimonadota bacterium]NNK62363.1 M28 family peptidase [Gemmatimonadota bacterium]
MDRTLPRRLPARVVRPGVAVLLWTLFACGDGATPPDDQPEPRPTFDGVAAQALVERQVAFGPRIPGREGHAAQLAWMVAQLDSLADAVETDGFTWDHTQFDGLTLELTNVVARFRPAAPRRLLFLAHWDTRPFADQADTFAERQMPVPGANDGASGTAVLLQVARHLSAQPPAHDLGIDLLFTDGEDFGPSLSDMLLGARRYAQQADPTQPPLYAVLLDLVGDADPSFPVERYSERFAPGVVDRVWDAAARLGYAAVFPREGGSFIQDDHVPLNEVGIPTANIIDFEYGPANRYWHTPHDLPDQTRASSLAIVGEVVLELIYDGV